MSQTKDEDVYKYNMFIILLFISVSTGDVHQFTVQCII